jgi:hypothetical protein
MFMACLLPPGYLNNEIKGGVMKKKTFIFVTFVLMYLMVPFMAMPGELHTRPVAVSPGSDTDTVVAVAGNCPTFSWSEVAGAASYRVVVFEAAEVLAYEEIEALVPPVISKDIHGTALSWTPSLNEALRTGGVYVWYVRAVDKNGFGEWSAGNKFRVEAITGFPGLKENLKKRFKEFGVEESVVDDVFKGIESEKEKGVSRNEGTKAVGAGNPVSRPLGSEGDSNDNVYYGNLAGLSLGTGANNAFFGKAAGYPTTNGSQNTFMGSQAGDGNSTGSNNTFIGFDTGGNSHTGNDNTFVGSQAGNSNTDGDSNVFIGYYSGKANTTGYDNTFLGSYAGTSNTDGDNNVFIGFRAGNNNTTGYDNTFLGYKAGYSNTGGRENVFLGFLAGNTNSTGISNSFLGYMAGRYNSTGESNTFLGNYAGHSNTTGNLNTFLGHCSGYSNTDGERNIFIGYRAGNNNTSGWSNVFLGYRAGYYETGSNKLYIQNSDSSSPLIYGDFASDIVKIYGLLQITGSLNVISGMFSLDNGSHWITPDELNILDEKTLVTAGSVDNDKLVTKGYVDSSDDVGGGLTGSYLTDKCISKWDDTNTRLVDSLISENAGAVNINGTLGIGTATPDVPVHLVTPEGTTAKVWLESTGGSKLQMTGAPTSGQFGTVSNHQLRLVTNATWKMVVEPDGKVGIGVLSPTHLLHLNGGAYSDGNTWTPASSRELKENIDALTGKEAMTAFEKLNPVKFNYKNNKTEDYIGFIAEDVPDLLSTRDRKGVNTMDVVALLTKVLQEQQKTVRKQTKIIAELRARIKKLENKK